MSAKRVKARGMTDSGAKLIVWATAASCAGFLLALPRPVAPRELPALSLDSAAVAAVEQADRLQAAVTESDTQGRVRDLYLEWGAAEAGGGESHAVSRRDAMHAAVAALQREAGDAGVHALRAEMLTRLPAALAGSDNETADAALLGAFPRMLARYGLSHEGRITGPPFVVRTLYAARFNVILGLVPTQDFRPIEREAYWGWLALGPARVDPNLRMDALARYEDARGAPMPEARADLLLMMGHGAEASRSYEAAYRQSHNLRLRNHALAAALEEP